MINFLKYRWVYFLISAFVLVPGIYTLVRFGLKPSIDFTGGSLVEWQIKQHPQIDELSKIITETGVEVGSVQTSGTDTYLAKLKPIDNQKNHELLNKLTEKYGEVTPTRFETVGPTLGQELLRKTFVAALLAVTMILGYVAWAFKNIRYGVSAIIALFHDVLVVIGIFALLGHFKGVEVDSLFVTAVLTTMSFSVHDTIVVFDRIREFQKKHHAVAFAELVNQALTETMGRSLNNSLTIIFMLLALFLLGGDTIRWFALALLIGTVSGTYSSPFVAVPILYTLTKWKRK